MEKSFERAMHSSMLRLDFQESRTQHRRKRQRDEPRNNHAAGDDNREGLKELADYTADENDGAEDANEGEGRGQYGESHFAAAVDCSGYRIRIQVFTVPEDILQHHDRVVHDHPYQ